MAKKPKTNIGAIKTIVSEKKKVAGLKRKISDRKMTNAALTKMRTGKALTMKDSARVAAAKAKPRKKARKKG